MTFEIPHSKNFIDPHKADLYQKVVEGLVMNKQSIDAVMRQLAPELPADSSPKEIMEAVISASKGVEHEHPRNTLPISEQTDSTRTMMNVFDRISQQRDSMHPLDRKLFDDYFKHYIEFRVALLESRQAGEEQNLADAEKWTQVSKDIEAKLQHIASTAEDVSSLSSTAQRLSDYFDDLIFGQSIEHTTREGKQFNHQLFDPHTARKEDVVAAAYQAHLIQSAMQNAEK